MMDNQHHVGKLVSLTKQQAMYCHQHQQNCQSGQDVLTKSEGQRVRVLEGQYAKEASVPKGTNIEEEQKQNPLKAKTSLERQAGEN